MMSPRPRGHDPRAIHRQLLAPHFPPDELMLEEDFVAAVADGTLHLHVESAGDPDSDPLAVVVAEFHEPTRVLLVDYLAVSAAARGGGIGGRALNTALSRWQEQFAPRLVLAEVEHPTTRARHAAHGDPAARVAFYHRLGAKALPVPYAQPPLHPAGSSVEGLMLVVLREDGRAPDHDVAAEPVRLFLSDHLAGHPLQRASLAAIPHGRVEMLPLDLPTDQLPNPPSV